MHIEYVTKATTPAALDMYSCFKLGGYDARLDYETKVVDCLSRLGISEHTIIVSAGTGVAELPNAMYYLCRDISRSCFILHIEAQKREKRNAGKLSDYAAKHGRRSLVLTPGQRKLIKGQVVAFLDDCIGSGETLAAATAALRGASRVEVVILADFGAVTAKFEADANRHALRKHPGQVLASMYNDPDNELTSKLALYTMMLESEDVKEFSATLDAYGAKRACCAMRVYGGNGKFKCVNEVIARSMRE